MNKTIVVSMAAAMAMALMLAACGKESGEGGTEAGDGGKVSPADSIEQLSTKEPLTLRVWTGLRDDSFQETFAEPIKKKYPNVTLEKIQQQNNKLSDLIAANAPPDIISVSKNLLVFEVMPTSMQYDMSALVKQYDYKLNRFRPEIVDSIRSFGEQGQLYGLPQSNVLYGLLYNKQLFDKFGVSYPLDGMTWEDAIQLATRLSRTDAGVQYRGLDIQFYNIIASQMNVPVVDKSGKARLSDWAEPARVFKRIYDVPGNNREIQWGIGPVYEPFFKETLAMLATNIELVLNAWKEYPNLQWDMVTVPTLKEAPGTGPYLNYTITSITPTSKHKEDAFKVIAHLLSDEVQESLARKGYTTPLASEQIQRQFMAEVPSNRDKNFAAAFQYKQTDPYVSMYQTSAVDVLVRNAFDKIRKDQGDINSVLREADEAIDKKVAELKSK